jgi:hypothetical protein
MSLKTSRRLTVQRLEDRATPSVSTTLINGTLTIRGDNLPNSVLISESAPGKFTVTNNAKTVGTFSFSNLTVQMGNGADTVELKLATALTGNLNVTLGNGTDTFTTANSTLGSKIGGDAFVNLGLGGNRPGVNYDQDVLIYNVNIGGNLTVLGSSGSGAELLDIEASKIGKTVSVTNIFQTSLGAFDDPARAVTVGVDLSVSNYQKNTDGRGDTPPAVGGNGLNLYSDTVVNRNVSYTGGSGIDRVLLPQDFANATPVTIGGNVTVNAYGGVNTLSLGTGAVGVNVGGNVRFDGGADIDRFFLDSGSTVGGGVYANLGEGDNQVFGDSIGLGGGGSPFNAEGDGTVNGDVTIILGNGNNFIGSFGLLGNTFSVGGNLTFQVGNGDNTGGDANAPGDITFFNTALSVGGTARYQAGTGSNSLDITNETIGDLVLLFGGGPTTVLFNQASGFFNGDLYLDFGTGFGPKTLGGSAALGGMVTILNYP